MYKAGEISRVDDNTLPPWERGVRQGGLANKKVIQANALEFKEIMDRAGLRYCIMFGTLLGAVREHGTINNDSDFDVFCFAEDYLKWPVAKSGLADRGFVIPDIHPLHDDFVIRNGEKIDINWVFLFGRFYVYNNDIYYPSEYFTKLSELPLFGTKFKAPAQPERLLSELYGPTWHVPQNTKGKINIYPK